MSDRLGLPVCVDNDANLGALAEHSGAPARGVGDIVYLKLATGIGAGLVLDGRLYEGVGGTAGEIGHTSSTSTGASAAAATAAAWRRWQAARRCSSSCAARSAPT